MTCLVTVECDNPSHARGKVSKLARYSVSDNGDVQRDLNYSMGRIKRTKRIAENDALNDRATDFFMNDTIPAPVCKLCGRKVPTGTPHVDAAIRSLAVDGQFVTVTLTELCSKIRKQGQR